MRKIGLFKWMFNHGARIPPRVTSPPPPLPTPKKERKQYPKAGKSYLVQRSHGEVSSGPVIVWVARVDPDAITLQLQSPHGWFDIKVDLKKFANEYQILKQLD